MTKAAQGTGIEVVACKTLYPQGAEKQLIKSVVDRVYPLEQIREAYEYVDTGRKRGAVVLTI